MVLKAQRRISFKNGLESGRVSACNKFAKLLTLGSFARESRQCAATFKSYFARDGLADSAIEGILDDGRGDLWLSTSDGLSRFTPRMSTVRNACPEMSCGLQPEQKRKTS